MREVEVKHVPTFIALAHSHLMDIPIADTVLWRFTTGHTFQGAEFMVPENVMPQLFIYPEFGAQIQSIRLEYEKRGK